MSNGSAIKSDGTTLNHGSNAIGGEDESLSEYHILESNKKFRDDIKNGIPIEIRGEVWCHLVGNKIRI